MHTPERGACDFEYISPIGEFFSLVQLPAHVLDPSMFVGRPGSCARHHLLCTVTGRVSHQPQCLYTFFFIDLGDGVPVL